MAAADVDGVRSDRDERCLVAARLDPAAFAELYERRQGRVAAFFRRRVRCPATTSDLTAETFARLWATRGRFDPDRGSAMAWTMGIAGNLYRQWSHQARCRELGGARLAVVTPAQVVDDLGPAELRTDLAAGAAPLAAALDALGDGVRAAVVLRLAHELPYEEVARRLGCSVGAARVRVSRGLGLLRRSAVTATAAGSAGARRDEAGGARVDAGRAG